MKTNKLVLIGCIMSFCVTINLSGQGEQNKAYFEILNSAGQPSVEVRDVVTDELIVQVMASHIKFSPKSFNTVANIRFTNTYGLTTRFYSHYYTYYHTNYLSDQMFIEMYMGQAIQNFSADKTYYYIGDNISFLYGLYDPTDYQNLPKTQKPKLYLNDQLWPGNNDIAYNTLGGSFSLDMKPYAVKGNPYIYIGPDNLFETPYEFKLSIKLRDGTETYKDSVPVYFYDKPVITPSASVVCQDETIHLTPSYEHFKGDLGVGNNYKFGLQVKLASDVDAPWRTLENKYLTKDGANLTYDEVRGGNEWREKEIYVRAFRTLPNGEIITSEPKKILYLPILGDITIQSNPPKCAGDEGSFTLIFGNVPGEGFKDANGTSVPLIITIKQYCEERLANDITYIEYPIVTPTGTKNYYYHDGATMLDKFELTKNTLKINNEFLKGSKFVIESGMYDVSVRVNNSTASCGAKSGLVEFKAPLKFKPTASAKKIPNVNGNIYHVKTGDTNATLNLYFEGGTKPYKVIEKKDGIPTREATNLSEGEHELSTTTDNSTETTREYYLTDNNGCTHTDTVTFYRPADISFFNLTPTPVSCNSKDEFGTINNGTISVQVLGGVPNYKATLWSNGAPTSHPEVEVSSDLISFYGTDTNPIDTGKYTIIVKDALNPDKPWPLTEITVGEPSVPVSFTADSVNNRCAGGNTGSFTITPSGGNGEYSDPTIKDSEGTTHTNGQLATGTYSIQIMDKKGCGKTLNNRRIEDPEHPLTLSVSATRDMSCPKVPNAEVTATVTNLLATDPANITFWRSGNELTIKSSNTLNGTFVLSGFPYATEEKITIRDKYDVQKNLYCEASQNVTIPLKTQFNIHPDTIHGAPCVDKYGIVVIKPLAGEGSSDKYVFKKDDVTCNDTIHLKGNSYNSFKVTDSVGCTATYNDYLVPVRANSLKLANVSTSDVTSAWCQSSASGSLTVHAATNGAGNVLFKCIGKNQTFNWQPSGTFSNLLPAMYTIQATDDSLCTVTTDITVPIKAETLQITAANTHPAACRETSATGVITANSRVNGIQTGYGNIYYTIGKEPQANPVFPNLTSGAYTVTATDQMNCQVKANVEVGYNSDPVTLTIDSVFDQTCNELANARIYLKAHTSTIGTAQDFKFILNRDTSDWNTETQAYMLNIAGTYTFKAIDKDNCGTAITHTIKNLKQAPKPTLKLMAPTACSSANNGVLTITNTPNRSLPKYRYTLGAETKYASAPSEEITFSNLYKGYHIITARDTLGCMDTTRFLVEVEKDSVKIKSVTTQLATCIAAQNGSVKLVASSADPLKMDDKYTFSLNGSVQKGDSVTYRNLAVNKTGEYTAHITDRFGCRNSAPFIIGVRPDTLNIFGRPLVNPSCPGYNDGLIVVRRKSGDEKFRYDLTSTRYNHAFYTTDTLVKVTALPQGTYTLTVRDTNNCRAYIDNIVLTDPQPIEFASVYNNYIKHKGQPEGIVEAKVWKGNNKYNYEWINSDNGATLDNGKITNGAAMRLHSLYAGNYILRVQDTAKCAVGGSGYLERRFTIAEPEKDLMLTIKNLRNASCFGYDDGEFTLEASGGWGNQYRYGFDAAQLHADARFTGRKKESITMFAADTSGVVVSIPVTIDEPSMLTASLSSKQDVSCYGEANGSATLNIAGGNYPHYFISSNDLNWEKGYTKHTLPVGRSTLYIRDTLNCRTTIPVAVDLFGPTQIVETSQITRSLCGFNNGKIVSFVSGGNAPYTYQWYKGEQLLPVQTNRADSLFSGTYRLAVTDGLACLHEFTFNVSDLTDLTIDTVVTTPVTCWGYTDGAAAIKVSKGNPAYIITWPDQSGGYSMSGLKAGTFTVGVTDKEKCKVFRDFTIATPVQIYLAENRTEQPLCEGRNDGSVYILAAGDYKGFDYTWNTGKKSNSIKNLAPGTYTVTVTDDYKCANTFDFNLQFQNFIKPALGRDLVLCKGNSVQLKAGAFSTYTWNATNGMQSSQPSITVNQPASYSVKVTDEYGCIGRDTINVGESTTAMTGKLLIATYIAQHDTVMIFEASWPLPDSVNFELEGCKILQTGKYFREVIFADTGTYKIGLVSYLNDCSDQIEKTVVVEPRAASALKSAQNRMIKSFKASPNPNDGLFDVELLLRETATARLRLINISTGITTDVREYKGSDIYTINYNLNLPAGMYLLHLQVGSEAQTKTLVIQ